MMYEKDCDDAQLEGIVAEKYSPADITSLFLRYRTEPEKALLNINKIEGIPIIDDKRLFSKEILEEKKEKKDFTNAFQERIGLFDPGSYDPELSYVARAYDHLPTITGRPKELD